MAGDNYETTNTMRVKALGRDAQQQCCGMRKVSARPKCVIKISTESGRPNRCEQSAPDLIEPSKMGSFDCALVFRWLLCDCFRMREGDVLGMSRRVDSDNCAGQSDGIIFAARLTTYFGLSFDGVSMLSYFLEAAHKRSVGDNDAIA